MSSSGIGAMVFAGAWLETKLGADVLSIGRSADNATEDCVLELCGKWFAYRIALRGGWIWLSACLMDKGDAVQHLLSVGDGPEGWRTICRLVAALERNELKSLTRPIEAGSGNSGFVIG